MIGISVIEKFKEKINSDVHFRELIKSSTTFFTLRVFGLAVGYLFTFLVTRKLGASAWGIFALCLTILQITSVVGRLGMDTALLRFIAEYKAQGKVETAKYIYLKSIGLVIPLSLILSIGLYLLAPIISDRIFDKEHLTFYIKLMAFAVPPLVLLYINTESLRAFKKIKEYVTLQNILPFLIALLIAGIFLLFLNIKKTEVVILSYIAGIILSFFLSSLFLLKKFRGVSGETEEVSLKNILSVSLPMLISSSLFMIMSWTDTIMLGMWRTEEEIGIYNVAVRLSMITSFTLMAINSIAAPKFAEFWGKRDMEGLKNIAQQSTKLIFWTSAPIFGLYLIFPKWFMGLFGEEFKKGALALIFLTIGQFVNAAVGSVGYILQMTQKEVFVRNIVFLSCLVNILLNIILIPKFGIYGASFSSMLSYIFWNFTFMVYIRMNYGFWTFKLQGG
jgi:O-antigen/teichoic acid export membrane protein